MVSETHAERCRDGDYVVVILLYLCEHTIWISVQCNLVGVLLRALWAG